MVTTFQRAGSLQPAIKNVTVSTALTNKDYGGVPITVNAAAGLTLTLPDATGSGDKFEVIIGTTVTSNNVIITVPDANNILVGFATLLQDGGDTAVHFETAADSDTITLNGSTKGGIKGMKVTLIDMANNEWHVEIKGAATGTEATPFSAAVS